MTRTPTLVLTALLVVALAGCVPAKAVDVAPSRTPTLAFASDEEAYIEALAVYSNLVGALNDVAKSGGEGTERLREFSTGEFLDGALSVYSRWPDEGRRQVGSMTFRDLEIYDVNAGPENAIIAAVCDDVSGRDIVNAVGDSVRDDSQEAFFSLLTFDLLDQRLLLSSRSTWTDQECPGR